MLKIGKQLLECLGDSELTAKFQYLCGVRNHLTAEGLLPTENPPSDCSNLDGASNSGFVKVPTVLENGDCDSEHKLITHKFDLNHSSVTETALSDREVLCVDVQNHCRDININKTACNNHNSQTPILTNNADVKNELSFTTANAKQESNGVVHRKNGVRNGFSLSSSKTDPPSKCKIGKESPPNHFSPELNLAVNGNLHKLSQPKAQQPYTLEIPALFYIFSFGASLGNELFYILFFSATLWNFDSLVIRRVLLVWSVVMYLGQAAKDIIRWPRPKSPPVVRLEERYELEFGMPSTHAMVGVAIPFATVIFMSDRYEFNYVIGYSIAAVWSLLVSLSRLYLGMHSVLDVFTGLGFAVLLMSITISVLGPLDTFLMTHSLALPVTVGVCVILCLAYPSMQQWSTARGDTTVCLAVFSGIYAGMWLTGKLTTSGHLGDSPPYRLEMPSTGDVINGLLRQVVGLVVILVLLTAIKMFILRSVSWLCGYDRRDPKIKQYQTVELPYKYVSYYLAAVATTYLLPLVFFRLNIERSSYYREVFAY